MYSSTMHSFTTHIAAESTQDPGQSKQMRIAELARKASVSRETIHFYLREGLLPPPRKVNSRVAYFDAGHLVRLRVIKELQKAHLPLALIREQLQAVEGQPPELVSEGLLPRLVEFLSIESEEPELSADVVTEHARLTHEQLAQLQLLGVLRPTVVDGRPVFTQADADAAAAARMLLDQGVNLDALRFVRRYVDLIEQEHGFLLHHLIRPALTAGRRNQVSATLGVRALRTIEAYLRRQLRREHGLFFEAADPLDDQTP